MKPVPIGINGFGRIGRCAARIVLARDDVRLVAINSRSDNASHAYLLKYDSIHGRLDHDISFDDQSVIVDKQPIRSFHQSNPADIPWKQTDATVIIESTGKFTRRADSQVHLGKKVKHVIISAPSPDSDATFVVGVNHGRFHRKTHQVVSNASCTTNCLATVASILHNQFGIVRGSMTTAHSPTPSQAVLDTAHKDPRRGRSTLTNIIPTSTGAAKALGQVIPELDGKIAASAIRVPNVHGSLMVLVAEVQKQTNPATVLEVFAHAAANMPGVLQVTTDELVSQDIIGTPYSAIVDSRFVSVVDDTLITVFAWYDNEWGYATRLIDLAAHIGR